MTDNRRDLTDEECDKLLATVYGDKPDPDLGSCPVCWNCDIALHWGRVACSDCIRAAVVGAVLLVIEELLRWVLTT